jgi:hypothetical protein
MKQHSKEDQKKIRALVVKAIFDFERKKAWEILAAGVAASGVCNTASTYAEDVAELADALLVEWVERFQPNTVTHEKIIEMLTGTADK